MKWIARLGHTNKFSKINLYSKIYFIFQPDIAALGVSGRPGVPVPCGRPDTFRLIVATLVTPSGNRNACDAVLVYTTFLFIPCNGFPYPAVNYLQFKKG